MARKKTPAKTTKAKPPVEDAVVVQETVAEPTNVETVKVEDVEPVVVADEPTVEGDASGGGSEPPTEVVVQQPIAEPAPRRAFLPMVLGGIIAGGIGYGAATYLPDYLNPSDDVDPIAAMQADYMAQVAALEVKISDIANRPVAPDLTQGLSDVSADIAGLSDRVDAVTTTNVDQIAALDLRIEDIEKRPLSDAASPAAVAAYERELDALRGAIADQRAQIEQVAADASAQIEAATQQAQALEDSAEQMSQNGIARAAVGRVLAALESGGVYAAALDEFRSVSDAEVPQILADNASTGIATLSQLQSDFPDAARAALDASLQSDGPAEGDGAVTSFFKSQFRVRSLTPQEGNSADAILSRAEAAVANGNLNDALAEVSALSDAAAVPMDDWVTQAQTRIDALSAANDLSASLTTN